MLAPWLSAPLTTIIDGHHEEIQLGGEQATRYAH